MHSDLPDIRENEFLLTFQERLIFLVKQFAGGKPTVFAKKAGIPPGSFHKYVTTGSIPKYEHLIRITEFTGYRIDWLLTGSRPWTNQEYNDLKKKASEWDSKLITPSKECSMVCDPQALYNMGGTEVNVFVLAGAGRPKDLVESEPIASIIIPRELYDPAIIPVKVRGRSMEPVILNGAYIGVDKSDCEVISGEIYAIWIPYEGAVVKRLFMETDKVILSSDNPAFPAFEIPFNEIQNDNFILGRVKWVIQKL